MKTYKIEVHSRGYEDTSKIVVAPTLAKAKQQVRQAIIEWIDHNALDIDTCDLPFTRITKQ